MSSDLCNWDMLPWNNYESFNELLTIISLYQKCHDRQKMQTSFANKIAQGILLQTYFDSKNHKNISTLPAQSNL
jgi:hypothetical protein